jgi:hypothetical protein
MSVKPIIQLYAVVPVSAVSQKRGAKDSIEEAKS